MIFWTIHWGYRPVCTSEIISPFMSTNMHTIMLSVTHSFSGIHRVCPVCLIWFSHAQSEQLRIWLRKFPDFDLPPYFPCKCFFSVIFLDDFSCYSAIPSLWSWKQLYVTQLNFGNATLQPFFFILSYLPVFALLLCFPVAYGALCLCVRSYIPELSNIFCWTSHPLFKWSFVVTLQRTLVASFIYRFSPTYWASWLPFIHDLISSSHKCIIRFWPGCTTSQSWDIGPHKVKNELFILEHFVAGSGHTEIRLWHVANRLANLWSRTCYILYLVYIVCIFTNGLSPVQFAPGGSDHKETNKRPSVYH